MKKLLISIGSILIMTFVVILFVNAAESKKDPKKAKSETTKTEVTAPCPATCNHSTGEKPTTCDPASCPDHKDGACDPATCMAHKDGNCDPAACAAHKEEASTVGPACGGTTPCKHVKPAEI
ncbi:MAG: hypothetical protein P1P86_11880 [Bacteroidales bacterium]|nr:hypothetical protein [Bacteroidales bacterium]